MISSFVLWTRRFFPKEISAVKAGAERVVGTGCWWALVLCTCYSLWNDRWEMMFCFFEGWRISLFIIIISVSEESRDGLWCDQSVRLPAWTPAKSDEGGGHAFLPPRPKEERRSAFFWFSLNFSPIISISLTLSIDNQKWRPSYLTNQTLCRHQIQTLVRVLPPLYKSPTGRKTAAAAATSKRRGAQNLRKSSFSPTLSMPKKRSVAIPLPIKKAPAPLHLVKTQWGKRNEQASTSSKSKSKQMVF